MGRIKPGVAGASHLVCRSDGCDVDHAWRVSGRDLELPLRGIRGGPELEVVDLVAPIDPDKKGIA